jgi:glycosyltransferase involved in cell wall biosynthesis
MTPAQDVLFVTHAGDPGGAEFKMLDLCQTLRGRAEVLLLQHGSLEALLGRQQIRFTVCPLSRSASQVRRESGLLGMLKALPGVLSHIGAVSRKGRDFSVIICMSQKSFVLASLAKIFMRRPILWFMNDLLSRDHFSQAAIRCITLLSRYAADHIVLNSKSSLEQWIQSGGRQAGVSVIYPVNLEDETAAQRLEPQTRRLYRHQYAPDGRPLIGMFGRISRWKGQEVFLRALAELPHVNAVIAGGAHFGEQELENRLRAQAADLGMETRVIFAGHVQDVIGLMGSCDVVVHCSTSPEPFGQVILQAMLIGTPVVASDGGGAREIVIHNETGQLTPMKDACALAAAIRRYLEDPEWSKQLAAKARERAQQSFSAGVMASRFAEILNTL